MSRRRLAALVAVFLTTVAVSPVAAQVIDAKSVAASGGVTFDVSGVTSVSVTITGTWVGTFVPKADPDGTGPLAAVTIKAQELESDGSLNDTVSITENGTYIITNPGYMRVVFDWTRTSGTATLTAVRGFGVSSTATIEGAELSVGAQPANDPHFVRCSDSAGAAPCAVTGPLTDAELRATPVPVSGDFTSDGLTDTELRATPVLVTATLSATDNAVLDDIADGIATVEGAGALLTSAQLIDDIVKLEDSVAGNGFAGVPILAVRQDSQSDLAADGDFIPVTVDGDGNLRVTMSAGSGGTALADDADFVTGTTPFTPFGGLFQTSVSNCTDGDVCAAGITAARAVKTVVIGADGTAVIVDSGSSATQGLSIQGSTGMVAVDTDTNLTQVDGAAIGAANPVPMRLSNGTSFIDPVEDADHDAPALTTGPQIFGVFDDNAPDSVDEGDAGSLRMSANRILFTALRDAAGNERGANVNASNELLVACASCSGVGVTHTDDAGFTAATDDVVPIAGVFDDAAPDSVNEGDAGAVRMSANRNLFGTIRDAAGNERGVNVDANNRMQVTGPVIATTAGGCTPHSIISAATVNETQIKATAGQLYVVTIQNVGAAPVYFKLYNDTAANVDETDTPVQRYIVPGNTAGSGIVLPIPVGMAFSTAITYRITAAIADNSTAAITANEVLVSACYL